MDAAPLTTLNLRLADAYRVEQHGLAVLERIAGNDELPDEVRTRAALHQVETRAQRAVIFRALSSLSPMLLERLEQAETDVTPSSPGIGQWIQLEKREIGAFGDLLPYARLVELDGLDKACAAALDLQRSVLHWLHSLHDTESCFPAGLLPAT